MADLGMQDFSIPFLLCIKFQTVLLKIMLVHTNHISKKSVSYIDPCCKSLPPQ